MASRAGRTVDGWVMPSLIRPSILAVAIARVADRSDYSRTRR